MGSVRYIEKLRNEAFLIKGIRTGEEQVSLFKRIIDLRVELASTELKIYSGGCVPDSVWNRRLEIHRELADLIHLCTWSEELRRTAAKTDIDCNDLLIAVKRISVLFAKRNGKVSAEDKLQEIQTIVNSLLLE